MCIVDRCTPSRCDMFSSDASSPIVSTTARIGLLAIIRCAMMQERKAETLLELPSRAEDYQRIEKAILFLEKNVHRRPGLQEIARAVNLSAFHFQRLFKRWAGISPKRFLQVLTAEHVKRIMENSGSLLEATYHAGLSSAGRLHDLFVNIEAMTPGEFRRRGEGLKLFYGVHASPFGECFIAVTARGICRLDFIGKAGRRRTVDAFLKQWPGAESRKDPLMTKPYIERIFGSGPANLPLSLLCKGTNFQIKVWQALLSIPVGAVVSYEQLARTIGRPGAVRAVANAVARNPVAFLIPCHRVIRKTGAVGGYRWGSARKKAILAWEAGSEEG